MIIINPTNLKNFPIDKLYEPPVVQERLQSLLEKTLSSFYVVFSNKICIFGGKNDSRVTLFVYNACIYDRMGPFTRSNGNLNFAKMKVTSPGVYIVDMAITILPIIDESTRYLIFNFECHV